MIPLILAVALLLPAFPGVPTLGVPVTVEAPIARQAVGGTLLPARGWATYYGEGLFAGVVRNQLRYANIQPDTCPQCKGYAAMLWPEDIDRVVCLLTEDGREFGPLWVVDVAAGHHRQALIDGGWVIDLQWKVWQELGFWNGPTMVTVKDCNNSK